MIGARVVDDENAWLDVGALDLIGERAWRVATGDGVGASELGELQDGTLTVRTSRQQNDVGWVVDGHDETSRQNELLPRLLQIDDVDAIGTTFPDILFHRQIQIACTNVLFKMVFLKKKVRFQTRTTTTTYDVAGQHLLNIRLIWLQNFWELRHLLFR